MLTNRRAILRSAGALAAGCATGGVAAGIVAASIPTAAAAPASPIEVMVMQMHAFRGLDLAERTEEQCAADYEVYRDLQARVIELEAQTPRDVALQFLADTDFGESDWSDEFQARLMALAGIGGAA